MISFILYPGSTDGPRDGGMFPQNNNPQMGMCWITRSVQIYKEHITVF